MAVTTQLVGANDAGDARLAVEPFNGSGIGAPAYLLEHVFSSREDRSWRQRARAHRGFDSWPRPVRAVYRLCSADQRASSSTRSVIAVTASRGNRLRGRGVVDSLSYNSFTAKSFPRSSLWTTYTTPNVPSPSFHNLPLRRRKYRSSPPLSSLILNHSALSEPFIPDSFTVPPTLSPRSGSFRGLSRVRE